MRTLSHRLSPQNIQAIKCDEACNAPLPFPHVAEKSVALASGNMLFIVIYGCLMSTSNAQTKRENLTMLKERCHNW